MNIVKRSSLFPSTSFFDDFLTRDLFDWSGWTSDSTMVPRANIIETNDEFRVEVAAPGLKKEDFQVALDNDMLTIHSEATQPADDNQKYTLKEFNFYSFRRSFHLPNTVDVDQIKATYKDGILSLLIPKKEEARKKPIKTISIS